MPVIHMDTFIFIFFCMSLFYILIIFNLINIIYYLIVHIYMMMRDIA